MGHIEIFWATTIIKFSISSSSWAKPFLCPCLQVEWQRNLYNYNRRKKYPSRRSSNSSGSLEPMMGLSCLRQSHTSIQGEEQHSWWFSPTKHSGRNPPHPVLSQQFSAVTQAIRKNDNVHKPRYWIQVKGNILPIQKHKFIAHSYFSYQVILSWCDRNARYRRGQAMIGGCWIFLSCLED